MSFFRSCLLVSLVSLLAAFGLLVLGSAMGYEEFRGGYAVLTVDASIEDRALRSLLDDGNFFGGSPVSESSQWVLLDEFDSVQTVPLDRYFSRISSFDPRNDGYAEKLRDVFVKDGKRFVYIPLAAGNWNYSLLDAHFRDILADIPFSLDYYGIGRPLRLFFTAYAVSSFCLLIICYAKRKSASGTAGIVALIPALSSLAFFGVPGIAAAALLFGYFVLIKEPLNELVTLFGSPLKTGAKKLTLLKKEIIFPYRLHWLFLPLFAAALAVVVFFSQLKLLFLLAVTAVSFAVFFSSSKILSLASGKRKRFTPVLIMRRRFPSLAFSLYMLPFTIAAFTVLFLAPRVSGAYVSAGGFDALIDEQDYYAHLDYQASFSVRQFGTSSDLYPDFFFDTDGLPSIGIGQSGSHTVKTSEFPPFPLKHLMDFFHDVNSGKRTDAGGGGYGRVTEMLSLLVLLIFVIPGLVIKENNDNPAKINFDDIKKFSDKSRLKGINRNKTLLYNGRNQSRIRKDA
jgi:hypothetical protein